MALLMVSHGAYRNPQAISNVIKYVTRSRKNETRRRELLSYGCIGASYNPEMAIEQFKVVQRMLRDDGNIGKRIFHETLQLNEADLALLNGSPDCVAGYARKCASYYYLRGFQVVYAVHWDKEKKYHIHFVINDVSFVDGHKWSGNYPGIREELFRYYLIWYHNMYIEPTKNIVNPISFDYGLVEQVAAPANPKTFYAVASGKNCGIYEDYCDCLQQIQCYVNSRFEKCTSLDDAYGYLLREAEYREYYEIKIHGFSRWFQEYHSFFDFLKIFKDKYRLLGW